jgi:hypothetical protein
MPGTLWFDMNVHIHTGEGKEDSHDEETILQATQ